MPRCVRSRAGCPWKAIFGSSQFFLSYPPALPEFIQQIAEAPVAAFERTGRPHGVLVGVAAAVAAGLVQPVKGEPFAVAGAISIFGESDGHAARPEQGVRAPYLFVAVVGRPEPDHPVEVLRAYLHPCMTATWLLPVDSDHERATVRRLVSLQRFMREKDAVAITIEKKLFDLMAPAATPEGGVAEPHEPVIPDFVVSASSGRSVVVETMGFDLPAYRERKARLHSAMSQARGGAPVLQHEFCGPASVQQIERDRMFWRECRRLLLPK